MASVNNFGFIPDAQPAAQGNNFGFIPDTPAPQQSSILNGPTTLNSVVNSPGIQGVLGAGDALRNMIASGANMLPGVNISPVKTGTGTAYNVGNIAGNIGGFLGGGEALDTARMLSEGAPVVGQLASALGGGGLSGVARRALGSAAYSAATNEQNRAQNAGLGAGLSIASEAIPGTAGILVKGAQYFMPQRYAQDIIQNLGGGQNLSDATKSVLSDIREAYQAQKDNASDIYNSVRDSIPSGSIYAPLSERNPVIYGTPIKNGVYQNLPDNITDNYTSTLQDMHNDFIKNPTFSNAHALQSELGAVSRQLTSGVTPPTISTINSANAINTARNALKTDMDTFLNAQSPELAQQYKNASDTYQQNVVPYKTNPKIYAIATGDITNVKPSALSNIFSAPDESMQKVISDLPETTMDKVLYTKLGQTVPNKSAQGLLNSYQNLQQQGLGENISPQLLSQIGELENRIKARNGLQMATAGLSAAALGGAHGSATAGAMMGLGAGAVASPFMNYIGRRLPVDDISAAISNVLRGTYPTGRSAILANYLNNSGVKNGS